MPWRTLDPCARIGRNGKPPGSPWRVEIFAGRASKLEADLAVALRRIKGKARMQARNRDE